MNIPFLSLKDVTALHGAEINEAVVRVVNGGYYLQGAENERFEKNYADYIGSRYCVGCGNGLYPGIDRERTGACDGRAAL